MFYLHHGMIDRTWWIWQMLDPSKRKDQISGTDTFLNVPPSANTTLDTPIDLGYAAGPAVTVHAYSPPLPEMTRYDLTPGGLVRLETEGAAAW